MGCFTGQVERVGNTRIFARATRDAKQFLVYQMEYSAANDVAMILPLPVPPNTGQDAVQFIRLSGYDNFFAEMENGFPLTRNAPVSGNHTKHAAANLVGSFEASFIPSQQELAGFDEPFRIPTELWNQFPEYSDFGFAVFKLRAGTNIAQPLALEFPMRNPQLLFFPTVEIRNGQAPEEVSFDHDLFCQARAGWLRSYDVANSFMRIPETHGIVAADERISRMTVQGAHPNSDILVGLRA